VLTFQRNSRRSCFWDALLDALMRSCSIKIRDIRMKDTLQRLLVEDQPMVEAFLSRTPQEALTDGIGSGSVIRCVKNLNRTRGRHPSETRPKFAIVIADQILRCLSIRGGFSQLLRHPGIGRRPCNSDMDHPPRSFRSMRKNAKSGRKQRSLTCKKSQAQICAA
jgi:hypothetical protein